MAGINCENCGKSVVELLPGAKVRVKMMVLICPGAYMFCSDACADAWKAKKAKT